MLGAVIGDLVGSRFETENPPEKDFTLITDACKLTDDSILTFAVAKAILNCAGDWDQLAAETVKQLQAIGRKHPNCGYGALFNEWLYSDDPKPYNSYGNGAAMRVSPCGLIAKSETEAKHLSRKVTEVTHNHPEGLKGAESICVAIFMAKNGATMDEIQERIERDYYLPTARKKDLSMLHATCQDTVPLAFEAFFSSESFEDAIRKAVSYGVDCDTVAAMTGSLAQVYYGIPRTLEKTALRFLDIELRDIYADWKKLERSIYQPEKFRQITKFSGKLAKRAVRDAFIKEFALFALEDDTNHLRDFRNTLEKYNLELNAQSMVAADPSNLPEEAILALLTGAIWEELQTKGVVDELFRKGRLQKWLERLKAIDDERIFVEDAPFLGYLHLRLENAYQQETLEISDHEVTLTSYMDGFGEMIQHFELINRKVANAAWHLLDTAENVLATKEGWVDTEEMEIPVSSYRYMLTAAYDDGSTIEHSGAYDRAHLPEKLWMAFTEDVRDFRRYFGDSEITTAYAFRKAIKPGEVIYCGVEFSDGGKTYHYRTQDLSIDVGDEVIVPTGSANIEQVATVVSIDYRPWDDPLFPLELTKQIIRKSGDESM